ncbi:MAG: hypothetical protein JKY51_11045, partial [Opitutaceae bacterium]|nr:hypothetical protein [Opitutaceae bacterium]
MKSVFYSVLLTLIVASVATYYFSSESERDKPVVHWVSNPTPTRKAMVETFYQWLKKNDYPEIEIKFDAQAKSSDKVKTIVQGVSGVANDILDCYIGILSLYQSIGLL